MKTIIGNLSLWKKFALIGLCSLSALVPPFWLVAKSHLGELDAARSEFAGIAPASAMMDLLRGTQAHRAFSVRWLAGDESAKAAREQRQAEVEQALVKARGAAASLHDAKLDAGLESIAEHWKALAAAVDARSVDAAKSLDRHTALIAEQLAALEAIRDGSGLILDPEAGSYHAVASGLGTLPQLSETLAQARSRALLTPSSRADGQIELAALLASAKQQLELTHHGLAKSVAADTDIGKALAPTLDVAVSSTQTALQRPDADELDRALDAQHALVVTVLAALHDELANRIADKRHELFAVAATVAAFAALALGIIVTVTRSTLHSVRAAVGAARALANGELTHGITVATRDELGELLVALRGSMATLAGVVGGIQTASDSVNTAAGEIAQGNVDLSGRTEQQASSLQQTAAAMDQINATVRHSAETAREAAGMAHAASAVASEGGQAVARVVTTMDEINANSKKIADIIGVIDGIAFQTNILALNAAVEAARAGEQGRGFAVVAGEVRSLAGRASEAAKQIKELIEASVHKVELGSRQVDEAGKTMDSIVLQVSRVTQMIAAISHATAEQTTGLNQVNTAVTQLDRMTQQNAALVEQSAAAAESLKQQATQLVEAVGSFRIAERAAVPEA